MTGTGQRVRAWCFRPGRAFRTEDQGNASDAAATCTGLRNITGQTAPAVIDSWRVDPRNFRRMWEFGKPIIGAINGWAMGAGSWLSLFTHITLASENAVFAQPEVRHGSNTSFMWTLLGGYKNALRYGLTGDHIDAQEALRIGLVVKSAGRSTARRMLQYRRAHRPRAAGNREDQLADRDHGFGHDGFTRRVDLRQSNVGAGAHHAARRAAQTAR